MDILWILAAFLLGSLFSRLKLPPLIGYLSAGLLLAWGGYEAGEILHEIAEYGVLFLLFSVGLHIRVKDIARWDVTGVGLLHVVLFGGLIILPLIWIGFTTSQALLISALLSLSSTILTAKSLEQRSELGALHGRIAIGILILQDILAVVLLGITSGSAPSPYAFALLGLPILRPLLVRLVQMVREEELTLLLALSLALGGATLFNYVGLSMELGAITMGMLLAGKDKDEGMERKLWSIREFFLIGFFLEIGLRGFPEDGAWVLIGLALAFIPLKTGLFFFLFIYFRLRSRTAFIASTSLSSYSEFILITGAIAARGGFLPEELLVTFALIIGLSFALNAILTQWEDPIWGYVETFLTRLEREGRHPDKQIVTLGNAEYLIVGMGTAGCAAYNELRGEGLPVVGMDIDPERIERNLEEGRRVIYGDIQDVDLWQNLDLSGIRSVMIAMGNKQSKANATRMIRSQGYKGEIFALTMRPDEQQMLESVGATAVSIPIRDAGRRLAELSMEANGLGVELRAHK